MATKAAHKRLTREYQAIQKSPPEFISAHPSETNILEWHYILTGPPDTVYAGGQYWGTLVFPSDYPFAPPAIRMHTPSGRFRCSERLCLSISDFHPKSFNPAWEVSTILLGVLSFMTSEEMTTGSVSAKPEERSVFAANTRWWNSTGGGSTTRTLGSGAVNEEKRLGGGSNRGFGAIKAGDGGKRFKEQFPELDEENWKWMEQEKIDPQTGQKIGAVAVEADAQELETAIRRKKVPAARAPAEVQQSWLLRNRWWIVGGVVFAYVVAARLLRDQQE
ncbi:Ubiquitin-conjugating enzyme E2 6 [Fulvia fulva]|uniref:Ubiquitin-conjugating enzyme E2 6 n=1 Tax=Passalora fulva TaxID=5499 RepID=A0A9Q8PC85_PASFU|nr:Ubiquitin-conjugating enzyme E2 6 [Fulvia fulva]KAK4619380.1 Ubiquitin-conjugating enzyme E2 6 [Fulvia fulva]KAK4621011.1 Ubiquitin-conjugating enzyme E2 6 [Fulvia fulva]UJO19727.1 Ubiquitin-conjugating enzyme E2 6 [Fulvia fulva]WPV17695.1 Ubiquitin-conjugating enzyme E2 6 [Fulvia fulva]WPV31934.1 Ubiquitin-conjugating enzyme E2 6 [Fulvia fulva]